MAIAHLICPKSAVIFARMRAHLRQFLAVVKIKMYQFITNVANAANTHKWPPIWAIIPTFIIICAILFWIYVRIAHNFWSRQPVVHWYDVYRRFFSKSGKIRTEMPEITPFIDLTNIITKHPDDIPENVVDSAVDFMRKEYLQSGTNKFLPKKENIMPYFVGHLMPPLWSVYNKHFNVANDPRGRTEIVGIITGRPLIVTFYRRQQVITTMQAYYIDYLCVSKLWRKTGIAPALIQTHEYNQSFYAKHPQSFVSIFKREEELTGCVVPAVTFKTWCFTMEHWKQPPELDRKYKLLLGDSQNIRAIFEFIMHVDNKWECTIVPNLDNIIALVKSKNLFIVAALNVMTKQIEGCWIYRDSCVQIKENGKILTLIGSVCKPRGYMSTFIAQFRASLAFIVPMLTNVAYLSVEDVSHNKFIVDNILVQKQIPIIVSPTTYTFYNYISPFLGMNANKMLIIT